tara:strand:+ start:228 stop:584 length:357 start_codon:yes stop_codon:yes gene_type:complete
MCIERDRETLRDTKRDREGERAERASGLMHALYARCITSRYIHDAAGKQFVDNKNKGVMGRTVTISNIDEHYDYNAATMLTPKKDSFGFDFNFSNYIHVLYRESDFINLESDAVEGGS